MEIRLQIPDNAYQRLVSHGGRIQGTIGLVSPNEGNFNEHRRYSPREDGGTYRRLKHGRVSVSPEKIRMTLCIKMDRADICPSEAIENESREASGFVGEVIAL